jgi:hypothetical protein
MRRSLHKLNTKGNWVSREDEGVDIDLAVYEVKAHAKAKLVLFCSATLDEFDLPWRVPARVTAISSLYCLVKAEDVNIEYEPKEVQSHELSIQDFGYENEEEVWFWSVEPNDTLALRVFTIDINAEFTSVGDETKIERFLDNLEFKVEFEEGGDETHIFDLGKYAVEILDSKIGEFDFHVSLV